MLVVKTIKNFFTEFAWKISLVPCRGKHFVPLSPTEHGCRVVSCKSAIKLKPYANRGGCYPPKPKAEADSKPIRNGEII